MMRYRAIGAALCVASLVVVPQLFADHHDKDKEKESKPAKESTPQKSPTPPKQSQSPPPQTHVRNPPPPQTHVDKAPPPQTHVPPSSTGSNDTSSSHKKDRHQDPQNTNQQPARSTYVPRHPSSPTGPAGTTAKTPTYAQHDRRVEHTPAIVNREHLQERMRVHPDTPAREHAYRHSREERVLFSRHSPPVVFVAAHRPILTRIRIVPTTYHYRRTVFYDEYAWQPPAYVYGFSPRYGLWDATFLAFSLDHIAEEQYALMFYHHQNDAEMQQWMADARELAAENDDLRTKLDALDGQVAAFQDSGVENDPTYVPPDAQDVALSPEVIEKLTSKDN